MCVSFFRWAKKEKKEMKRREKRITQLKKEWIRRQRNTHTHTRPRRRKRRYEAWHSSHKTLGPSLHVLDENQWRCATLLVEQRWQKKKKKEHIKTNKSTTTTTTAKMFLSLLFWRLFLSTVSEWFTKWRERRRRRRRELKTFHLASNGLSTYFSGLGEKARRRVIFGTVGTVGRVLRQQQQQPNRTKGEKEKSPAVVMVVRREWGGIKEKEMARQCHFVSPKRNWIRTHTHRHTHTSQ